MSPSTCRPGVVYGESLGELFAGAPGLIVVKLLISIVSEKDLAIMLLDVTCAFLFGAMRRSVYLELPRQGPKFGEGRCMGKLKDPCM